jgi:hypothetical protein
MNKIVFARLIFMMFILLNIAFGNVFAGQSEWKKEFYNPNPHSDGRDFILPLPGGGAMAFRPVVIVQKRITEAKRFTLGNSSEKYAPVEYPRYGSISGVFEEDNGNRLFYIGKYEVTQSQFDAVMKATKPANLSRLPKVNVSWFEAVRFCHELTLWLLKNQKQLMPKDGQALGFVRLPTEEEWEFACRGGELVQSNFFYRDHFIPENEREKDYVQYYRSGDVETVQPIGKTKKPNPLGLYDILGNAGEICFDIFRINHHYGRSGGYVVRGGDIDVPGLGNIRSSFRFEAPFYNQRTADAYRRALGGFRVLITAPFFSSQQRIEKIENEWNQDFLPAKGQLRLSFEEALKKINYVHDHIKDPELKKELSIIKNSHDSIARELYAIEFKDATIFFRIGSYSAVATENFIRRLEIQEDYIKKYSDDRSSTRINIQRAEKNRQRLQKSIEQNLETYGDAVESLNEKYRNSPDLVSLASEQVIAKKRLLKQEGQIRAVKLLHKHVRQFKQRNPVLWRKDINELRRSN